MAYINYLVGRNYGKEEVGGRITTKPASARVDIADAADWVSGSCCHSSVKKPSFAGCVYTLSVSHSRNQFILTLSKVQ